MTLFSVDKHKYMLNSAHWTLVRCRSLGLQVVKSKTTKFTASCTWCFFFSNYWDFQCLYFQLFLEVQLIVLRIQSKWKWKTKFSLHRDEMKLKCVFVDWSTKLRMSQYTYNLLFFIHLVKYKKSDQQFSAPRTYTELAVWVYPIRWSGAQWIVWT